MSLHSSFLKSVFSHSSPLYPSLFTSKVSHLSLLISESSHTSVSSFSVIPVFPNLFSYIQSSHIPGFSHTSAHIPVFSYLCLLTSDFSHSVFSHLYFHIPGFSHQSSNITGFSAKPSHIPLFSYLIISYLISQSSHIPVLSHLSLLITQSPHIPVYQICFFHIPVLT